MGKDLIDVTLTRENSSESWGFRLAGGRDFGQPLSISQVSKNSLAARGGIVSNDLLVTVGDLEVFDLTHAEAEKTIQDAGDRFSMVIERETVGRKISFEKSATSFALKLGGGNVEVERKDEAFISNIPITEETPSMAVGESVNFKKFEKKTADISTSKTLEDVARKANMRKDWNCPWVRKDGGLKQSIRYIDEPNAPAKTSWQHYYSEPKSILGSDPELTKDQIQAIIREHGADSRPESRQLDGEVASQGIYREEHMVELQEQEMRVQQQLLEEQGLSQQEVVSQQQANLVAENQETYCRDRDFDSQAPPDLEPVSLVPKGFVMPGNFQGQEEGYEPSADELIDVLKNLENLAAGNPTLYRTIVEQIQGSTTALYQTGEQHNGTTTQYEQEMYEQQLYQQQQEQQQYQEQQVYQQQEEQQVYRTQEEQQLYQQQEEQQQYQQQQEQQLYQQQQEQQLYQHQEEQYSQTSMQQTFSQQQVEESMATMNMSEAEYNQHIKMKRLEAEAQEEVRQTLQKQREAKMKKVAEPPRVKEIMVIAGDGKKVNIQLGGEPLEADSRKQVAEAAGLKHVPLPDFDNTDDSAWAGSLKKTSRNQAREELELDENPWAGSLRHVNDKPRKASRKENDEVHGGAPWMGTLRHVVHDNKVTKNYGVNQFQSKRYPDEDASNPFEATQGSSARPAFPLTPAAIINGSVLSRDEMARKEEEEELERIRNNIGSKTVSSALLQVLMPKLLKMHETKYTPMDRVDAEKIMEQILGMQIGINPDQQADANEEADMIIRAIMQDEVGKSVYSRMADDLEAANTKMKKLKKVKKVKDKAPLITA